MAMDIGKSISGLTSGAGLNLAKKALGKKSDWITWIVIFLGALVLLLSLILPLSLGIIMSMVTKKLATGGYGDNPLAGFDNQFSDSCQIVGPDKNKAVRTETKKFYITAYCPETTGTNKDLEGGPNSAADIRLALGAVAVPPFNKSSPIITGNTPDYPWGTTFEIPGYGTGVAIDHGAAIQKAGIRNGRWPATPYDHLDIFVGWGKESCKKWATKSIDVKVYWFDPKEFPPKKVKNFVKRVCSNQTKNSNYTYWEKRYPNACSKGCPSVQKDLITINFVGKNIKVNKCAAADFQAVSNEIKSSGIKYNIWRDPDGGSYNCRANVNNPSSCSPHAYGIAIDINPDKNPNIKPRPSSPCPKDIPQQFIDIFKRHNFRWGGDFKGSCDMMHFEWTGKCT